MNKEEFLKLDPCAEGLEFAKSVQFDPQRGWDECKRPDWMFWLLERVRPLDKQTAIGLSIEFASHTLHLWGNNHPNDLGPRQAIEAAKAWLEDPTEENRLKCEAASYAAYASSAAWAASAASAARDAEREWQANKIRELVKCPIKTK